MMSFYKFFIGIIIYLVILPNAQSQFVYHDQGTRVSFGHLDKIYSSARVVLDSIRSNGINVSRADIFEVSDKTYLLLDGTFYVFEWNGSQWTNRYKNVFFGYNFGSTKIVYKEHIYSLGGYGFWHEHGQLIEFLPSRGEWEIIKSTKDLPFAIGYIHEDTLFLYTKDSVYTMDVHANYRIISSKSSNLLLSNIDKKTYIYNLENYGFIFASGSHQLIEKQSGHVFKSDLSPFKKMTTSISNGLLLIRGDSMLCYDKHLKLLDSYSVHSELKFFDQNTLEKASKSSFSKSWAIFIVFLILSLGLIIWYSRRKMQFDFSSEQQSIRNMDTNPILSKLESYAGKQLSQDELDEIFEISAIYSSDTKRSKRSLIFKEMNQLYQRYHHTDIIVRVKDPKDKRFYVYDVKKVSKEES